MIERGPSAMRLSGFPKACRCASAALSIIGRLRPHFTNFCHFLDRQVHYKEPIIVDKLEEHILAEFEVVRTRTS